MKPVSTNAVNLRSSSGGYLDTSFPILNKKQTHEMKLISTTAPTSSGENTLELNAHTPLKKKLQTKHNDFHLKNVWKRLHRSKFKKDMNWFI